MNGTIEAVFGPVPSQRLGRSLGIDPVPLKTCDWNCVYCQLGRSDRLELERREWVPAARILEQLERALRTERAIDWITFVGSGEPLLHSELGTMIRRVRAMTAIPVAVITNGSLLWMPEVRRELLEADAVLPSLDAGSPELYRRINRPHGKLTFERHTAGLEAFSRQYRGRLWLEVMLVAGLNDSEEALRDIAAWVDRIGPDEVHLAFPTRPPAEPWVRPPDDEALMRAAAILGERARIVHPAEGTFDLGGYTDVLDAVVGIVTRHPMRADQLERSLGRWDPETVRDALERLERSGRVRRIERFGTVFWTAAGSRYA